MSDKKILVGDMSRETAIGILKLMLEAMEVYDSIAPTSQRRNAVQMAIASLETDEAYQLEYENLELCEDCISRKEAISWIENLRTLNEHYHPNAKDNHLIDSDSAIDHLKQVPSVLPKQPKFCEDCILKSDALDSINWAYNLSDAYEKINMLPSVLPKADKPKEKWILKNVEMSILKIECPICGFHRNVINETLAKFNYCPNCGADMREVEE